MKKKSKFKTIVTAAVLLLGMSGATAQSGGTDGFFNYEDGDLRETGGEIITSGFENTNGLENAPIGGGLLLLTGMGILYAATCRKEDEK